MSHEMLHIQANHTSPSCCLFLFSLDALETEGLFRISAGSSSLDRCITVIDAGERYDFSGNDMHIAANILKYFFKNLPGKRTYARFC
jgi:hypothetical protein